MKLFWIIVYLLFFFSTVSFSQENKRAATKNAALKYIDQHSKELTEWNNQIWEYAEPSLKEYKSVQLLVSIFKKEGFTLQENVSGFPTMFIATYGTGKPVIGLFGEYDADPGASNKIVPRQEELVKGGYGHGGGHNILGVGSLGAALAIKNLIKQGELKCTVKYFGTTAEGSVGAKAYLAKDGYFNDLDLSLYWHPAPATGASTAPWDALIEMDIVFPGKKINVIRQLPTDSTTLSAVELLQQDLRTLRLQMTTSRKINYTVRSSNTDINSIPDSMRVGIKIQCTRQEDAMWFFEEIQKAVAGVNQKTGIKGTINVTRAMHQFLPNVTAMRLVHRNMELLGPVTYTSEDQAYTKEMQSFLKYSPEGITDQVPAFSDQSKREQLYGYASDIGEASWIAPEIYFVVRSLPGVPMHRWPGTAFSGHPIGHKGMLQASKILSMTIIDYVESKTLQQAIRKDFLDNSKGYKYRPLIQRSVASIIEKTN